MAFVVRCKHCDKFYITGAALKKHHIKCHTATEYGGGSFIDEEGAIASYPEPLSLKDKSREYQSWLSLLVEQISGRLSPHAKGAFQRCQPELSYIVIDLVPFKLLVNVVIFFVVI